MSQYWQGYWTDHAFTPKRLRNWEISKWYPNYMPSKHCVTTEFITDDNGHILDDVKKDKHSPWGTYKGTWNLPKKITRSIVKELSTIPQYKKDSWELYVKKQQKLCKQMEQIKTNKKKAEIIESSEDTAKEDQTDKQACIFFETDEED